MVAVALPNVFLPPFASRDSLNINETVLLPTVALSLILNVRVAILPVAVLFDVASESAQRKVYGELIVGAGVVQPASSPTFETLVSSKPSSQDTVNFIVISPGLELRFTFTVTVSPCLPSAFESANVPVPAAEAGTQNKATVKIKVINIDVILFIFILLTDIFTKRYNILRVLLQRNGLLRQ